jgi:hypothetical protein
MDLESLLKEKGRLEAAKQFMEDAGKRTQAALKALQGEVDLIQQMGESEEIGPNAFAREVAKLSVSMHLARAAEDSENAFRLQFALADLALDLKQSAETLAGRMGALAETTQSSTSRLADRIEALTKTTDEGTRLLSNRTVWLALATVGLVIAALVQAYFMATAKP